MKPFFVASLFTITFSAFAQVTIQEELYLPKSRPEVIKELINAGTVEIDHVTSEGFEVYGPKGISKYLESKNILHFDMKAIHEKTMADYPSSAQIVQKLKSLTSRYPRIMQLIQIGKSVKGKELLVVKISDNVKTDEVEPEFKYISSMHGDEITGRELSVSFIEEIGQKYGRDREITELVNNMEIYIMPSMNPDGSDLKQRGNARGIDLNRNFPDMTRDRESRPNGREIETQAVMKFQEGRQFALSANFHGGTIVANYPWDSIYDKHPMEAFVKELSIGYSERNPEMRRSTEFPGGITNGAAWYVVKGGMQDWSYVWHNDLQITIELSHEKWPRYSEIPGFYRDNRDSMVYFMSEVHRGAGIKFSRPGVSGVVEIEQTSRKRQRMGSFTFKNSEFYKVLPEGEYTFTVKERRKSSKRISVRVEKNLIHPNGNYVTLD